MDLPLTQGEQNLALLQKMIPADEKLYFWCLSQDGELYASTCPEEELLFSLFAETGGKTKAAAFAAEGPAGPRLLGSSIGLQWWAACERERKQPVLFLLGPVFFQPPNGPAIREELNRQGQRALGEKLDRFLQDIPVMPYHVFARYSLMLHNMLTGEHLGMEAFFHEGEAPLPAPPEEAHDRGRVYQAERAMLRMVRDGDINYYEALQGSIQSSFGVPIRGKDPLRQAKTSVIVFTSLVCRAAMEGGLSPELAYPLGDSYIQTVEDCRDSGELSALAHAMYHDFVYQVHRQRTNPDYSHVVQKCCDYIELSLDRKVTARDLAALVGYTEYYLTEKFKKETGLSVSSYIKFAKIERARVLLSTTDRSIQEIAERLAFNTPNYFIQCFRQVVGTTPAQYRKKLVQ